MDFYTSFQWSLKIGVIKLSEEIKNIENKELLNWWKMETALVQDQKIEENLYFNQLYDRKFEIALDANTLYHSYLKHFLNLDLSIKDISEDVKKQYPLEISTKELLEFSEIFKAGYVNKINVGNNKITKIRLIIFGNKLDLQNEEGYTLNDIAVLVQKYFELNFYFNQYYKFAEISFSFKFKNDVLKVYVACDI